MSRQIKINLIHKLPTPYNSLLFEALAAEQQIDLQVYHLWSRSSSRPWTVDLAEGYPNKYMHTVIGLDWALLYRAWSERTSFFIVGDWAHLATIAVLLVRVLRCYPVAIWADTPQEQLPRSLLKRLCRAAFLRWLLGKMTVVYGTGQIALDVLAEMGASRAHLVNLPVFVDLVGPDINSAIPSSSSNAAKYRSLVGCSEGDTVFLMSGQCTFKKGQDIGLIAFATLVRSSPSKVGMLIAGDGPCRQPLEELACKLGIADRTAFLGWLNPADMHDVYCACDVLVHPARWDPFPLVILEAMSWRKAVVGTDVCGSVKDRIISGENGFSVPVNDVQSLAAVMALMATQPLVRSRIGQNARTTAEKWPVQAGVSTIIDSISRFISMS